MCFGLRPEDNYFQNIASGKKIEMAKNGGSYVVKADFVVDQGLAGRPCRRIRGTSHKSDGQGERDEEEEEDSEDGDVVRNEVHDEGVGD
jgi:hypothetical protein